MNTRDWRYLPLCVLIVLLIAAVPASSEQGSGKLPYKSTNAFAYAKRWCGGGNDCRSSQYKDPNNFDCTHFMSHVLNAGGVKVIGSGAHCESNLCIRVKELADWFSSASAKYTNVRKLEGWQDARRGDFCFLQATIRGQNLSRPYHVMLLTAAPKANGAKVFAHENNHCDEFVEFKTSECVYYWIEE
jgi:hypothetical protein